MKFVAAIIFLLPHFVHAQVPANPAPQSLQLRTQATVVPVPALVRSADGKVIFTLKADDFRVTDDGIEQKLTLDEDTDGEPLALVVAVETGGVGARRLASYGNLSALLGAVVGDVPHHVGWLDSTARRTLFRASNQART